MICYFCTRIFLFSIGLTFLFTEPLFGQHSQVTWYIQSGAHGDGKSAISPIGSTTQLEHLTQPNDIIIVLPAKEPLSNGIALKKGQRLIGLQIEGKRPEITNTDSTRLDGFGILLSQSNYVSNLKVNKTISSGVFGKNVSETILDNMEIVGANQSHTKTEFELIHHGNLPHGGIVFVQTDSTNSYNNQIISSRIIDPIGVSIGYYSHGGSKQLLRVQDCVLEGGTAVSPPFDSSILTVASGENTLSDIELSGINVSGRMSRGGRNVLVLSSSKAKAKANMFSSISGEVGQDGVLGVVWSSPADVTLNIEGCILEKAMTNIEGTILNFPPADSLREKEARVSINILESILRDAQVTQSFGDDNVRSGNIVLGSSPLMKRPMPKGEYELTVMNSKVTMGRGYGLYIGILSKERDCDPEQGSFKVLLRNNEIWDNGESEIILSAQNAFLDARQNCWNTENGDFKDRIFLGDGSGLSQLDLSGPNTCQDIRR